MRALEGAGCGTAAYNQVMQELQKRNFTVVQQEVGADRVIHVQVRRFA